MNADAAPRREIPFNHEVLKWARERLECAIEAAATRANVSIERVGEWESGERKPTVRQARKLATLYDRPFLEFFSTEIPNIPETQLVPDFRFHAGTKSAELIALREVQGWAEEQRLNALDLLQLIGESPPVFPNELYASIADDVDFRAQHCRKLLNFPIDVQFEMRAADRASLPNIVRHKFEECGVLVLKKSEINKLNARGICLFADPLPVIVYGSESPAGQAFTLAHEFAHIMLKASAISGNPRFGNGNASKRIEGWCNRFAAAFLMPKNGIEKFIKHLDEPAADISDEELQVLANRFAVSSHAMLIRLVNLGYVQPRYYWRIKRPQFIAQEQNFRSGGRPTYYGSRYKNSRGDFYTGLVLEAWNTGRITNHNAAEFMGIKNLAHLNDIRDNF